MNSATKSMENVCLKHVLGLLLLNSRSRRAVRMRDVGLGDVQILPIRHFAYGMGSLLPSRIDTELEPKHSPKN